MVHNMPVGRKRKSERQDKTETQTRILDVAAELIAEQGYAAASISKIAKQAGVLPGSIYWAFDSKEQILAAVLTRASEQWKAENTAVEGGQTAPPETLEDVRSAILKAGRSLSQKPEFLRLIMVVATERQAGSEEVLAAAREIRRNWRDLIEDTVFRVYPEISKRKLAPGANRIGRLTIQLLYGAFLSLQIEPNELSADHLFEEVAETLVSEIERVADALT